MSVSELVADRIECTVATELKEVSEIGRWRNHHSLKYGVIDDLVLEMECRSNILHDIIEECKEISAITDYNSKKVKEAKKILDNSISSLCNVRYKFKKIPMYTQDELEYYYKAIDKIMEKVENIEKECV